MDKWYFLQRNDGAWYWQHTNAAGAMRVSAVAFESENDCVGNAIYHGFQPRAPIAARTRIPMAL